MMVLFSVINSSNLVLLSILAVVHAADISRNQNIHRDLYQATQSSYNGRPFDKPGSIYGTSTNTKQHPLFILTNGLSTCGAILISKRFVVTAANCVGNGNGFRIRSTETIYGYGSVHQEYPCKKGIVHPEFNKDTFNYDVALFELEEDIDDSFAYIRLGELPVEEPMIPMTVLGFGDTNQWETKVKYIQQADCNERVYNNLMSIVGGSTGIGSYNDLDLIHPSMMCAFTDDSGPCRVDLGGPLILEEHNNNNINEDLLVGIVSWGFDCAGNSPSMYTRISHVYDWIIESMCSVSPDGVPSYVDCHSVTDIPPSLLDYVVLDVNDPNTSYSNNVVDSTYHNSNLIDTNESVDSNVHNNKTNGILIGIVLVVGMLGGGSMVFIYGRFIGKGNDQDDVEQNEILTHPDRPGANDRRSIFASSRTKTQNKNFRVSKNPDVMKAERIEAFFYNHGMEIAVGTLYLAANILVACHGAYQFTPIGGFTTDDNILRITLPIARGGGRLVTLNCAIVLLTACKYLWTCVRTYVTPFIPIGFPIDHIMPKYHSIVARTAIVAGCVVHTLPQIVNYATRAISIEPRLRGWTFGDGFATKQLLWTGTLLTIIFSTFFVTTRPFFRKTAAGFRWFWFLHVGGIAAAYPLLLLHGTCKGRPVFLYFALLPLALYLFDIAMRRSKISTTTILQWKTHEAEGQRITELIVECPENFVYTPGQYAELRFLPISTTEWHPFTIASAPNDNETGGDSEGSNKQKIVFYIKSTGRWTSALYNYASAFDLSKTMSSTTIQIRGPHGAPAMNYFEYKHIIVIGSGVGVTPLLSIWKYLVERGRTMVHHHKNNTIDDTDSELSEISQQLDETSSKFSDEAALRQAESEKAVSATWSRVRASCVFLEKVFESMTVSLCLLVLFVLGETLAFVLQLFGFGVMANSLGAFLSINALAAHGSTVLVSVVALGWSTYLKYFRCWLDCTIIVVDATALWFSVRNLRLTDNGNLIGTEPVAQNAAFFVFFGAVVGLQALRTFHIFYVTLKPRSSATIMVPTISNNSRRRRSSSSSSNNNNDDEKEICSIDGILINRKYSNMKFAARSLLRPILEDGLDDLFSMEFYGTREKSKEQDQSEHSLISDMMGSGHGIDIRSSLSKQQHDRYFHPGRPDWDKIFLKALAKAHKQNPEGESVGVFFCGSPAIAKDLQVAAARITACHQFAVKQLDGKPSRCKLIVHSENF